MGAVTREDYDFGGWATKNDLLCADGRTIRKDAFKANDGEVVPLVWMHKYDTSANILGHALLENRPEGVYMYGKFNETTNGKNAKMQVENGDIRALSIYANDLKQSGSNVLHGAIREVSLVVAPANPGAYIDTLSFAHDGIENEEEAIISTGDPLELFHAQKDEEKPEEKEGEDMAKEPEVKEKVEEADDKTVQEVFDTLTEEQKTAVYAIIGSIVDEDGKGDEEDEKEGEEKDMKHNIFDCEDQQDNVLIHDGLNAIMKDGKKFGSLKESYLEHAAEYGIENIEFLQPEDHDIYDRPEFINTQPTGWVQRVMSGVHNTPFAKIRMVFADITEDEARAKGYIKGKLKKEEVFKLLKRSVAPTTIYKKQKFDRDDLIDADFDVVPWIKQEMEMKLDEERARAYIFGDGRSAADEDKISETNIIPVVADDDLYSIKKEITLGNGENVEDVIVDQAMQAMDDYQGSGNAVAFFDTKLVTKIRLLKDQFGHRLYKDDSEVAGAMGLKEIIRVPASVIPSGVYGVIVDLSDYNVGKKDGGRKQFFDDFDIDYNQQKYLIEARESGALTRPYSAVVLKEAANG